MDLQQRPLLRDSESDRLLLQRVLEAAPGYARIIQGAAVSPNAARDTFDALPAGRHPADKVVLGYFEHDRIVGCADIVRGYPAEDIAFIGLLLIDERRQRRGLGSLALGQLKTLARLWGTNHLRIAVVASNEEALRFWMQRGFVELFRKPSEQFTAEVIVMQLTLPKS